MLVVTLGNAEPKGKQLSLARVKSSLLDEQACLEENEVISDSKALITESDAQQGRDQHRSPRTRKSREQGPSQEGDLLASTGGSQGTCRRTISISKKRRA